MTSINAIRDSLKHLDGKEKEFADTFYNLLWNDYPISKDLFQTTEMENQKKELINAIVFIVTNLDSDRALEQYLKDSGIRHVTYGILPEHYPMVESTLKKTLKAAFGSNFVPELETAWFELVDKVMKIMKQGAVSIRPDLKSEFEG